MKVLVAGATGALGRQLVPRLAGAGHEVVRDDAQPGQGGPGARPRGDAGPLDALDRDRVLARLPGRVPR